MTIEEYKKCIIININNSADREYPIAVYSFADAFPQKQSPAADAGLYIQNQIIKMLLETDDLHKLKTIYCIDRIIFS